MVDMVLPCVMPAFALLQVEGGNTCRAVVTPMRKHGSRYGADSPYSYVSVTMGQRGQAAYLAEVTSPPVVDSYLWGEL